jgi:hypothetical protein
MDKLNPHGAHPLLRFNNAVQHGRQWLQKWDPYLDRLDVFASNLGVEYTRRMLARARRWDRGLLAMGGGLLALMALALAG